MITFASLPFDVVVPPLEPVIGAPAIVGVFVAVVLIEAVLLRLFKWSTSWARCLWHSAVINVVTTALGLVLTLTGSDPILSRNSSFLTVVLVFAISFMASVVVESVILRLLKRDSPGVFRVSLGINAVSYGFLFLLAMWGFNQ